MTVAAQTEPEVSIESMGAALDALVKAADATEVLRKGDPNPVENSGHVDERGVADGGRGSMSDSGGLDPMMIGKLAAAGLDAGTIAQFAGFMSGKKGSPSPSPSGMAGRRGASPSPSPSPSGSGSGSASAAVGKYTRHLAGHMTAYMSKHGSLKGYKAPSTAPFLAPSRPSPSGGTKKSMDAFRGDPDIAGAIDVSAYLEGMTARTAEQIDKMRGSLKKGFSSQEHVNRAMARAMYQIGSLLKSSDAVIAELSKRMGIVEKTPAQPKGATSRAAALSKSMPGEAGGGGERLKKHEVISVLSYMRLEKGIQHVGSSSVGEAIYMLEGGGQIDAKLVEAAETFVASKPQEASAALAYQ